MVAKPVHRKGLQRGGWTSCIFLSRDMIHSKNKRVFAIKEKQ